MKTKVNLILTPVRFAHPGRQDAEVKTPRNKRKEFLRGLQQGDSILFDLVVKAVDLPLGLRRFEIEQRPDGFDISVARGFVL